MDHRAENADGGTTHYLEIPDLRGGKHDTVLFIPSKFRNDPRLRLILYFHGFTDGKPDLRSYMHRLPSPLPLRKIIGGDGRFAFAMPWLGTQCASLGHITGSAIAFDAYLTALTAALAGLATGLPNFLATPGLQLILAAHSGGGDALSKAVMLSSSAFNNVVTNVWAFDCFYPYTSAPPWVAWANTNKRKTLSIYYTAMPKGTATISTAIDRGTGFNATAHPSAVAHDNIPARYTPELLTAIR